MNKWDSKRIAFISILIAMSISFVIIGTRFVAITSFPSIKISLAGLPIKIIGYTFGPVIGFIIGFTTDVISFVFMPAFYFPLYSVALGISGMLPGVFAIFYNYFFKWFSKKNYLRKLNIKKTYYSYMLRNATIKNDKVKLKYYEKKYLRIEKKCDKINLWRNEKAQLNFLLITGLTILLIVLAILNWFFIAIPSERLTTIFQDKGILKLISNKIIYIVLISMGIVACIIALIVFRFKSKNVRSFLEFTSIVTFIVITEFVNIPIIGYADYKTLKIDFVTSMVSSLATSFIKIWFNMVIITFAIKIVVPLIMKKTFNGYA